MFVVKMLCCLLCYHHICYILVNTVLESILHYNDRSPTKKSLYASYKYTGEEIEDSFQRVLEEER